ncbi:hypothetical protein [Serpentinicella alkaliphila]|uniref:SipL SPOCS domain-containing protein n=1 Tax=Serpentinicella alkaliphila TaxID=1734049 RepID=A0A4R2T5F0_9FIRM|nr:hypothetical protein [Serpentinicella alkaliphila]QUH26698.1 hypothetical protein HZR23_13845 [Serpentinicella alkaliphila]TCP96616.1 hypothetical protein EDD79_105012 [Serpentinicella alkaliphila]
MANGFTHDPYFPDFKSECIIAKKVYAQCQQRECFEEFVLPLPEGCLEYEFLGIRFNPGEIVNGSLIITPIPSRPNFSRVRFRVLVTFVVKLKNVDTGKVIEIVGELPEIQKDIVMFIPEARDEFTFKIVLETASQLLSEPFITKDSIILAIGVFMIVKVVGVVQLFIPAFGFCPEPPECEEFFPDDICEEFEEAPFPEFFPRQLEDLDL